MILWFNVYMLDFVPPKKLIFTDCATSNPPVVLLIIRLVLSGRRIYMLTCQLSLSHLRWVGATTVFIASQLRATTVFIASQVRATTVFIASQVRAISILLCRRSYHHMHIHALHNLSYARTCTS